MIQMYAQIDRKLKGKTFYLFDLRLTHSFAASKLYYTSITKDSKDCIEYQTE